MDDRSTTKTAELEARAGAGPLARKAILYSDTLIETARKAGQPGFDPATGWAELASFVDIPNYVRYGAFREIVDWAQYCNMLTGWGGSTDFWYNFRRLTETPRHVFWEIEEHHVSGDGGENIANSMNVFAFNGEGKIVRMDIYVQSEAALAAHSNWG